MQSFYKPQITSISLKWVNPSMDSGLTILDPRLPILLNSSVPLPVCQYPAGKWWGRRICFVCYGATTYWVHLCLYLTHHQPHSDGLPKDALEKGLLSSLQVESVLCAGQRHRVIYPNGERAGKLFLLLVFVFWVT